MVEFDVELIVRCVRQRVKAKIVELLPRKAWRGQRVKIDNGLPDGVDFALGNLVENAAVLYLRSRMKCRRNWSSIPSSTESAEDRKSDSSPGKIAHSLRGCRHGCHDVDRLVVPTRSKSAKKKVLSFLIGPPRSSVLIACVIRLQTWRGVEEIARIRSGTLPEPPTAAMERVLSALQHHVYNRSPIAPEFRGEAVVFNFELLKNLYGRFVVDVRGCPFALFGSADQRAVNPHFRRRVPLPVGNEIRSFGIPILRSGSRYLGDSSGKKREAEKAAVYERDIFTYSCVMSVPRVALSVSSRGAAVDTWIVVSTPAGFILKLRVVSWSTARTTFVCSSARKPLASTFTLYVEGRSPVTRKHRQRPCV